MIHKRNIKLAIEYDGTKYAGWQTQANAWTVQAELEKALGKLTGEKVTLYGAGRTDAGTHALGQVANFKTSIKLPVEKIRLAVNSLLPKEIVVKSAEEVSEKFNSRRSAKTKIYVYRISLVETALQRNYSWQYLFPLNLARIKQATRYILGRKDFSSFCVAKSRKESNICNISRAVWRRSGGELTFEIEGDRFLHAMVRILVGTLLEVGRGKMTPAEFRRIIAARDRRKAGKTAPACGLYLKEVKY
ncbi:MAG: tRNA pseudouridine(38-40) synthase TruA [candidate division Zixibacteria bacterium]|nr:tRNA pseudouridine(38-40) synthase TruA [candidate division Zixibacteria bacterium]